LADVFHNMHSLTFFYVKTTQTNSKSKFKQGG